MKRRNLLSGLLAAPLALKARLARFFERKPVELCNGPIRKPVLRVQPDVRAHLTGLVAALEGSSSLSPKGQAWVDRWVASASLPFRSERIESRGCLMVTGLDQPISNPTLRPLLPATRPQRPHVLLNPR